jgi:uncharacterized protein
MRRGERTGGCKFGELSRMAMPRGWWHLLGSRHVILEGLVTTVDAGGAPNISPMGPLVDEQMTQFVLRPYKTSRTYQNLKRLGQGVLHVTDDVEVLAHAAVHQLDPMPRLLKAKKVRGFVLADACRWYEFQVHRLEDRSDRTTIACDVICRGRIRDFFGFNRAKHAVLEAAILATRLEFLPPESIVEQFQQLAVLVDKTGGAQERRAFQFLNDHVQQLLHARQWEGGV